MSNIRTATTITTPTFYKVVDSVFKASKVYQSLMRQGLIKNKIKN